MGITLFSFRRKSSMTSMEYEDYNSQLQPLISGLASAITHVEFDVHANRSLPRDDIKERLQHYAAQLHEQSAKLAMGRPALQSFVASRTRQHDDKVYKQHQTDLAKYLNTQMQGIIGIYNDMMRDKLFAKKENRTLKEKIGDLFANVLTKVADVVRSMLGAKVRGNWTHSEAQKTIDNQFKKLLDTITSIRKDSKSPKNEWDQECSDFTQECADFTSANPRY